MSNYTIQFRSPTREGAKAQAHDELAKCFSTWPEQAVHANDSLLALVDAYIDLIGDDQTTVIAGSLSLAVNGDRKSDPETGAVDESAGIILHRQLYCGLTVALDVPREGELQNGNADQAPQQSAAEPAKAPAAQGEAGEANA